MQGGRGRVSGASQLVAGALAAVALLQLPRLKSWQCPRPWQQHSCYHRLDERKSKSCHPSDIRERPTDAHEACQY